MGTEAGEALTIGCWELETVFAAAPFGMLLVDGKSVIKKVNKTMLNMIGRNESEVIGRMIGDGLGCAGSFHNKGGCCCAGCEKCELCQILCDSCNSDAAVLGSDIQFRLKAADQTETEFWFMINSTPTMIDHSKYYLVTFCDITKNKKIEMEFLKLKEISLTLLAERESMQNELKRANHQIEAVNRARREFFADISSEVNSPLNGILGMIDLTLATGMTEEQRHTLAIAKGCAEALKCLIENIG